MYPPLAHWTQLLADGVAAKVPMPQAVHVVELTYPAYVPPLHRPQALALAALAYMPRGHSAHSELAEAFGAYVPGLHAVQKLALLLGGA